MLKTVVSFMQVLLNLDTCMNNLMKKFYNCFSSDLKGHLRKFAGVIT